MNKNTHYIVNFDDKTSLASQISVYRFWRQLHRQQRAFIIAFILLFIIIYISYRSYSNKLFKENPYEFYRTLKSNGKEIVLRPKSENEANQLNKNGVEKRSFSTPTNDRQIAVRNAMRHAWKAYRTYAWGYDELQPISKTPSSWFGLGLTIVDSIDTLYIMNMMKEYNEAREWIENSFNLDSTSVDKYNSHFELTIRILGGLLSIYHLTGDEIFLQRATDIGERLFISFNTSSGLPLSEVNLKRKAARGYPWSGEAATSEVGTVQLEMRDLSRATNDKKYENAADKSADTLHSQTKRDGLVPIFINPTNGHFSGGTVSFGARGDSYYEYLLKQWLQTGQKRSVFWNDWIQSMEGVRTHLWRRAYPEELYFVGELMGISQFSPKMDHLACFLAGNMGLGWYFHRELTYLLDMAKELTKTCYQMYAKQATGLSPEIAFFNIDPKTQEQTIIVKGNDAHNLLRPELIESLYYMYHLTNDTIYQQWGWNIFQSFEKYTKQPHGYSTIGDVRNKDNVHPRDKMESFFLAETLKYFYLLFDTTNLFPFEQWIFNTEAHPLPIYTH